MVKTNGRLLRINSNIKTGELTCFWRVLCKMETGIIPVVFIKTKGALLRIHLAFTTDCFNVETETILNTYVKENY